MDSLNLISDIQSLFAFADASLRWLSTHAYISHYLLIAALLFWTGYQQFAFRLAAVITLSTLLFIVIKAVFQSPRPYWLDDKLYQGMKEGGYGMPSGHSQNATVFGGITACTIKKASFSLLALLFIAIISLSRVYLGVHFPSQVLVGLGIGFSLVILWMTLEPVFISTLNKLSQWQQLILGLTIALTPLIITFLHFSLLKSEGSVHADHRVLFLTAGFAIGLVIYQVYHPNDNNLQSSCFLFLARALPGAIMTIPLWQCSAIPITLIDSQTVLYSYSLARGCLLVLFVTKVWPWVHNTFSHCSP